MHDAFNSGSSPMASTLVAQSKRTEIPRLDSPLGPGQYVPPTMRQKLEQQLAQVNDMKANIEAALIALDNNPGAEELLNALRKVNF